MGLMPSWGEFHAQAPDLAAFGAERLTAAPAYLATLREVGTPRVHPIAPIISGGRLLVFMEPTSPKGRDLRERGWDALHNGVPDTFGSGGEFFVRVTHTAASDRRPGHRADPPPPWGDRPRDRRTEVLLLSGWTHPSDAGKDADALREVDPFGVHKCSVGRHPLRNRVEGAFLPAGVAPWRLLHLYRSSIAGMAEGSSLISGVLSSLYGLGGAKRASWSPRGVSRNARGDCRVDFVAVHRPAGINVGRLECRSHLPHWMDLDLRWET